MGPDARFRFVQFEFGFLLGPADGRYLARPAADREPTQIIVLRTLGAPQRRLLKGRRPRRVQPSEPEAVPTSRATLVRPEPCASSEDAEQWLESMRADPERASSEIQAAVVHLNGLVRAHRAVTGDAYARDVTRAAALTVKIGYGTGDQVADGRFAAAYDVPRARERKRRAERLSPQEHLAAIVGGREALLAAEELVLRARADLEADRPREAALQARIALECVLAELEPSGGAQRLLPELAADRETVSEAGNVALTGDPSDALQARVAASVSRMEEALRLERLGASAAALRGA